MLDEFPELRQDLSTWLLKGEGNTHSHCFADESKLLFYGLEGRNLGGRAIGAEEVPGVESGEVLDGSEELITAHCCRDEFEVVSDGGVVDEGVGDHCGG
jgi:hypothetical protein